MVNNISEKIAKNIKKYRELKKFTQVALAARAGVSAGTIGMVETARTDISLKKLNAIAQALGVEPWELLKFE